MNNGCGSRSSIAPTRDGVEAFSCWLTIWLTAGTVIWLILSDVLWFVGFICPSTPSRSHTSPGWAAETPVEAEEVAAVAGRMQQRGSRAAAVREA